MLFSSIYIQINVSLIACQYFFVRCIWLSEMVFSWQIIGINQASCGKEMNRYTATKKTTMKVSIDRFNWAKSVWKKINIY